MLSSDTGAPASTAPSSGPPPTPGRTLRRVVTRHAWALLALPALLFIAVVFFNGFWQLFRASVGWDTGDGDLSAYRELRDSVAFQRAFLRTVRLSALTTVGAAVISYPVAYFVARCPGRKRNMYLLFILLPWLTSIVVRSFGWRVLLDNRGIVNRALLQLGVIAEPLQLVNNERGIVIGLVHVLSPFMMLSLLSVFMQVDQRMEEAAAMLGAGPVRTFRRVLLPMTRRGLATGSLLVFLLSAAAVVTPQILGGIRERTVAVLMYSQLLELYDYRRGAAIAFVLVALVVPVALILQLWERRSS